MGAGERYRIRYQHHDGIAYATGTRDADTLWEVTQLAVELLEAGYEITAMERVVTRSEPLTSRDADAIRLLTGGRLPPRP